MESTEPEPGAPLSIEEKHKQALRVLRSVTFSNAPGLKCFLEFIVSLSEKGRSDEISEYAIATQVFGRPPKFDPASDTIVRTQAYRLRLKLKEYYEREGKDDGVLIEVPKGHYVPLFHSRGTSTSLEPVTPNEIPVQPEPASAAKATWRDKLWIRITAVVLLALVVFVGGAAVGARWLNLGQSAATAAQTHEIEAQFWSGFFDSHRRIIISFWDFYYLVSEGNVLLPLDPKSPLRERFAPAEPRAAANPKLAAMAGRLYYENGYAPLGDMVGLSHLSMLFTSLGATAAAIRAHQLTLEELKDNDVVFLGSFEDRANLLWQPEDWQGRFARKSGSGVGNGYIFDTEAPAGAGPHFGTEIDPNSHVIRADHALVSVVPGVNPARRVVVLAGLTTSGTQGAAEFLSSEAGLRDLLAAIGARQNGPLVFPRFFQCVVRVEVAHGLDVIPTTDVTGAAFQPRQ